MVWVILPGTGKRQLFDGSGTSKRQRGGGHVTEDKTTKNGERNRKPTRVSNRLRNKGTSDKTSNEPIFVDLCEDSDEAEVESMESAEEIDELHSDVENSGNNSESDQEKFYIDLEFLRDMENNVDDETMFSEWKIRQRKKAQEAAKNIYNGDDVEAVGNEEVQEVADKVIESIEVNANSGEIFTFHLSMFIFFSIEKCMGLKTLHWEIMFRNQLEQGLQSQKNQQQRGSRNQCLNEMIQEDQDRKHKLHQPLLSNMGRNQKLIQEEN